MKENFPDFNSIECKANELVEFRLTSKQELADEWARKFLSRAIGKREYPARVQKLIDFGVFVGEDNIEEKLKDFFNVAQKALALLRAGFHLRVVTAMLGEAGGRGCCFGGQLGNDFDQKYYVTMSDKQGARKDLWGTQYLLPIDLLYFWLLDVSEENADVNRLFARRLENSELVRYELSIYREQQEQKLKEFIDFCH